MGFWAKLFGFEKPRSFQERYPHIHHALTNPEPPAKKAEITDPVKPATLTSAPSPKPKLNTQALKAAAKKATTEPLNIPLHHQPPGKKPATTSTHRPPSGYRMSVAGETIYDDSTDVASDLLQTGLAMNAMSGGYDDYSDRERRRFEEQTSAPEPAREDVDSKWYAPEPEAAPSRNDDYCAPSSNDSWSSSSSNDSYSSSSDNSSSCDTSSTSSSD